MERKLHSFSEYFSNPPKNSHLKQWAATIAKVKPDLSSVARTLVVEPRLTRHSHQVKVLDKKTKHLHRSWIFDVEQALAQLLQVKHD